MTNELEQAIEVWCSTYPRRVTSRQRWAENITDVEYHLSNIYDNDVAPFISVYGFPNGHPKDGKVPAIDTLFIDFDIPRGGEYRSTNPDPSAWYRDMSGLLTRVRKVSRLLVREGSAVNFRAALSGHKGVHLYLDFPALDPCEGTIGQFKVGTKRYADELVKYLEDSTHLDLEAWVDVDSSDMARLCRMPNTKHVGASRAFDEDRYCVPVSVRELAEITPNEYVKLTRAPRPVPEECTRDPSERAGSIITQYVREAVAKPQNHAGSQYDPAALTEYEKQTNDRITLEDVPFLTSNKPCIWAFRERDDMFNHGAASHSMELNAIACLVGLNVPIDVIVEYFSDSDDFDEEYTRGQVESVIARDYNQFRCETVWEQAEQFCLKDSCNIYRDEFLINQKPHQ